MSRFAISLPAVLTVLVCACAPAESSDGDAADEQDAGEASTAGGNGPTTARPGAGAGSGGAPAGGGSGGRAPVGGSQGTGAIAGQSELCALFHEEWLYQVATYHEPGEDPIVTGVYGSATFAADGSYEQNYRIGGISNIYSGQYVVAGDRLKTYDESGDEVFDYRFSCSDELRQLVLILENDDGSPSIVYELESPQQ